MKPIEQRLDGRGVGDVDLGQVDEHELVAGALAGARDVVPEHPGGACHEQPHRIEMSELSPTMKRYARGWRSPRRTVKFMGTDRWGGLRRPHPTLSSYASTY